MAKKVSRGPRHHAFRDKLLLNQWLISLFSINPLVEPKFQGKKIRPFRVLADPTKESHLEPEFLGKSVGRLFPSISVLKVIFPMNFVSLNHAVDVPLCTAKLKCRTVLIAFCVH